MTIEIKPEFLPEGIIETPHNKTFQEIQADCGRGNANEPVTQEKSVVVYNKLGDFMRRRFTRKA